MSGKQIFWALFFLVILLKAPGLVSEITNGLINLFTARPGG